MYPHITISGESNQGYPQHGSHEFELLNKRILSKQQPMPTPAFVTNSDPRMF